MAWGGKRPGAGRKPGVKPNPRRERVVATTKVKPTVPAEPKIPPGLDLNAPAIDPKVWMMMLPEIEALSQKYSSGKKERRPENNPFRIADHPPTAMPPKAMTMAMDSALMRNNGFAAEAWLGGGLIDGLADEGLVFLGYTYLSQLAERPEYRVISETIADDATRKWIDFDVTGDEKKQADERKKDPAGFDERMADPDERKKRVQAAGKTDKVKALKDDQARLEVQHRFYEQARNDGFFGRSHLFMDIRESLGDPDPAEMKLPIGDGRDALSRGKVARGSFRGLRTIEPVWTYPLMYNAINPLLESWYNPQVWYVMGQEIHGSRIPTFIGHPVPDLLKPAYSFGGISLSQMAKPYVDIWLQTRQSVASLIHSFSVMVLMTDLSTLMQPGNVAALLARVAMFNMLRDNQGTFVVNKNTEDFKNVSASLAGLHELQAQSQEHMASVSRIPLVKLTGIQPAGLNASSEGEIKVYDDTIMAYQNRFFRPNLTKVVNFEQLSLFGDIDPEITFHFEPLRVMTEAEKGQKQKDDADTRQKYVDMGAFSPGEIRTIAIDDPDLPFTGLDPEDVPDLAQEEEDGLEPIGGRPQKPGDGGGDGPGGDGSADRPLAGDAEFRETEHPRAPDGKFGSGGGGGGGGSTTAAPAEGDRPYSKGIKAFGLEHAEKQKKEWRKEAPSTLEGLISGSPANQDALAAVATKAAAAVGTEFKNPGVKSRKRLVEKIEAGRKPENITDAVRGGFNVDTPEDGDKIVHMLAQHFEVADEGWQKNAAGYFDRKTIVRFPDGQVGEIQMWPPGMLEAKEAGGHKIYEKWRTLPEDSTEKGALNQQMVDLYAKVEADLPSQWKSLFRKGG